MTNEAHEKGMRAAAQKHYSFCRQCDHSPKEDAADIIKAYLEASGQVLVPKEPTNDMEVAGGLKCEKIMFEGDLEANGVIFHDMGLVYREMIAAAPQPFSQPNTEGK